MSSSSDWGIGMTVDEAIELVVYAVAAGEVGMSHYKWCSATTGRYNGCFVAVRRLESSVNDQLEATILGL